MTSRQDRKRRNRETGIQQAREKHARLTSPQPQPFAPSSSTTRNGTTNSSDKAKNSHATPVPASSSSITRGRTSSSPSAASSSSPSSSPPPIPSSTSSRLRHAPVDEDEDVQMISPVPLPTSKLASASSPSSKQQTQKGHVSQTADNSTPLTPTPVSAVPQPISDLFESVTRRQHQMWAQLDELKIQTSLPGLLTPFSELYGVLSGTFHSSVNNAALLLGPKGSGKHVVLQGVLSKLRGESLGRGFVVVRLHGKLHLDDTSAMREIVNQLCQHHAIEPLKANSDFHANLAFLLEILSIGSQKLHPIFFVLEEFEEFTRRNKQTLLYNLADLLQSGRAQMAIVGITKQMDVYEKLEKRIRSRMSHRRIIVGTNKSNPPNVLTDPFQLPSLAAPSASGLPPRKQTPDQLFADLEYERLVEILKNCLELRMPGTQSDSDSLFFNDLENAQQHALPPPASKRKLQLSPSPISPSSQAVTSPSITSHNSAISNLFHPDSSPDLHALLQAYLRNGRTIGFFKDLFKLAIVRLGEGGTGSVAEQQQQSNNLKGTQQQKKTTKQKQQQATQLQSNSHPYLTEADVIWAAQQIMNDLYLDSIATSSTLQLCLLVSFMHLSRRHLPLINFQQAYDFYLQHYKLSSVGAGGVGSSGVANSGRGGVDAAATSSSSSSFGSAGTVPFFPELVARKSFESLMSNGDLLIWSHSTPSQTMANGSSSIDPLDTGRDIQRTFLPVTLRIEERILIQALKNKQTQAPTWIVQWATRGSS